MDISLDLKSTKNTENGIPLEDLFETFSHSETLGVQDYSCEKCGNFQEATKQLSFLRLPPTLTIQLKVIYICNWF